MASRTRSSSYYSSRRESRPHPIIACTAECATIIFASKRKGTAKPQWAGAMRSRNSQRLPRRAAPAAGSRRVRHLVAERVRGSGRARPSECPRSSPRSLHVHVHVRSRGRANVRPKRAHLREENAPQWRCFPVRASRHPAMDLQRALARGTPHAQCHHRCSVGSRGCRPPAAPGSLTPPVCAVPVCDVFFF